MTVLLLVLLIIGPLLAVPQPDLAAADKEDAGTALGFVSRFFRDGALSNIVYKLIHNAVQVVPEPVASPDVLRDAPVTDFSDDEAPTRTKEEPAPDEAWKSVLLGPRGVLTEIFNAVKDKVKDQYSTDTQSKMHHDITAPPQPDATPEQLNFAKVFESFMQRSKSDNFDEPLPELPFIGICNRLNCGDIYKAVDEFRKSEFFSNFQTAMSLIHDPKGWDIIGNILQNPEIIENYVGKNAVAGGRPTVDFSKDELVDIGVDFSESVDGKAATVDKTDSGPNSDYYSEVKRGVDDIDHVDVDSSNNGETVKLGKDEALPEISESIDAKPTDYQEYQVEEVVGKTEELVSSQRQTAPVPISTVTPRTTPAAPHTVIVPKRDFRRNDDYYAMYYDN